MPASRPLSSPLTVILTGVVALAIAMSIGRFAFTPMLPLMLRDGTVDAATGTEWAMVNYFGYLLGAFSAAWFARDPWQGVRVGLIGVVVTTFGMVWAGAAPWLGLGLRGAAGVFSAWVLVCASSGCLLALARLEASKLSGWIYIGVGSGIAGTGLLTWLGGAQPAKMLWVELGVLAVLGALYVLRQMHRGLAVPLPAASGGAPAARPPDSPPANGGNAGIVLCYSAFGFGYIVPATYLPTMARELVDNPLVFGLTWPVFGLAAALSVAVAVRWAAGVSLTKLWAVGQALMAVGTALPLVQQTLWALALAAVLVGGTFLVTTMAGLQLARQRQPHNPTALLARMTAGFAAGQIAGPLFVRLMGSTRLAGWDALAWASALATLVLVLSAVWLWRSGRGANGAPAER